MSADGVDKSIARHLAVGADRAGAGMVTGWPMVARGLVLASICRRARPTRPRLWPEVTTACWM